MSSGNIHEDGWDDVKVTSIIVKSLKINFSSIESWLDFNNKHPNIGGRRKTCACCKANWSGMDGVVNLAQTNKGNKPVCDRCVSVMTYYNRDIKEI